MPTLGIFRRDHSGILSFYGDGYFTGVLYLFVLHNTYPQISVICGTSDVRPFSFFQPNTEEIEERRGIQVMFELIKA